MVSKCNRIASLVVLNYIIFLGEVPKTPLTVGGSPPSRPFPPPPSCRRHSVNTNGVQWPYHFLKADDGPDFIWVTRGLYSSMNTMFTLRYQQDNSWYVYIHIANALKRLRKLQSCLSYHVSRESNFASYFLSVHGKTTYIHVAIGPRLRNPVFGDL